MKPSIVLHQTAEYLYLESSTPNERNFSLLRIERSKGHTDYAEEVPSSATRKEFVAMVGQLRLLKGPYLVMISGCESVGKLGQDEVFRITSTELVPLEPFARTVRESDEREYVAMLRSVLGRQSFYFSPTLDLTNSLQRRWDQAARNDARPRLERLDQRFFWNRYLVKDFVDPGLDHWLTPIMLGFVGISDVTLPGGKSATLAVISRRNTRRVGTRYTVRGSDRDGQVANNVETEQLLMSDAATTSLVQTRGSIPLFWKQITNVKYKPRPLLDSMPGAQAAMSEAFQKHFYEQLDLYGAQVLINLIDQKGAEKPLGEAFAAAVLAAPSTLAPSLRYVDFDFHRECRGMKYENIDRLLANVGPNLLEHAFFAQDAEGERVSTQLGVARTNCIDSLDRTNAVQSRLARASIAWQLGLHGCSTPLYSSGAGKKDGEGELSGFERGVSVELGAAFVAAHRALWADNGDILAHQYAGTGALKSDYTRTGKRSASGALRDGMNSMRRYWINNFEDGWRQDAYDLLLGNHVADADRPSPFRRSLVLPWTAVAMLLIALVGGSAAGVVHFAPAGWQRLGIVVAVFGSVFITQRIALYFGKKLVDRPSFAVHQ